jgi:hypothetical protein
MIWAAAVDAILPSMLTFATVNVIAAGVSVVNESAQRRL